MISLDFHWQTNEFMLYCRSTNLIEMRLEICYDKENDTQEN